MRPRFVNLAIALALLGLSAGSPAQAKEYDLVILNGDPCKRRLAFHRHSLRGGQRHDRCEGLEGPEGRASWQTDSAASEIVTDRSRLVSMGASARGRSPAKQCCAWPGR